MARERLKSVLEVFVHSCFARLVDCGIAGTPLQRAWSDITRTTDEHATFCMLVGALGISPYGASSELAAAIDRIYDSVGERAAIDLCMASSEDDILSLGGTTAIVADQLNGPHQSDLSPLKNFLLPNDSLSLPSWNRGKRAATGVRKLLDIRPADHFGADKFFDRLHISASEKTDRDDSPKDAIFSGAVDRIDYDANFVLLQSHEEGRRFAASRAVFLALSSEAKSRRLVTDAMTRDQQASRAFAAEILVPADYLRAQAIAGQISRDSVHEIARKWRASVDVVKYQAMNIGLLTQTSF